MYLKTTFAVVVSWGLLAAPAFSAPIKIEEQVVGPAPGNLPSYQLSRTGASVASLAMKGSRSVVVINGVEGPLVDELLTSLGDPSFTCVNAVLFSMDGSRHAYAARIGDNYVVIRDGKEIYRGPFANRLFAGFPGQLTLSSRGQHLTFLEKVHVSPSQVGYRLVMDGKPGPLSSNNNSFRIFISPDESRWAYVAQKLGGREGEYFTMLDGREVPHAGHMIRFTGDNKWVTLMAGPDGVWTLSVDGKAQVKGVTDPEKKVWVSSVGSRVAAAIRKPNGQVALWVDGKEVAAAEGAKDVLDVTFSPDGKRYLATCQTAAALFAITDGKKGMEYRIISYPMFTRDSSKALYVATSGSKSFVITDGQESEGFEILGDQSIKMPPAGSRFAYATGDGMNRVFSLVVDTRPIALNNKSPAASSLGFSPDGSRYAFVATDVGRSEINTFFLDGQPVPNMYPGAIVVGAPQTARREVYYVFSRDGKYVANYGVDTKTQTRGLFVNNKLVYPTERGISRAAFTPDGQHLAWASMVPGKSTPVPALAVFVDGALAVEVPGHPFDGVGAWEMTAEGVYQFFAVAGNAIKRYRITPGTDTNVDAMISGAAATQAKAVADAAAAKKKAEDDALADQDKVAADKTAAAAKAKADYEAAQAKRKADYAAAVAAKAKARQDAIDARNKARGK